MSERGHPNFYTAARRIISRGRVGLAARCVGTCQKDFPIERYYRDARIHRIYEGTPRSSGWSSLAGY